MPFLILNSPSSGIYKKQSKYYYSGCRYIVEWYIYGYPRLSEVFL